VCIITYFVPCLTAGQNAAAVGKGCCLWGFLSILGPIGIFTRAKVRGMIRESKGIDGSFGMDCVMHMFCAICALVQEKNELDGGGQVQAMVRE
jgi:Cys-rich protein (TIGR01571 family)